MKKLNDYYNLDSELSGLGISHVLSQITEIARQELDAPRTNTKAQKQIIEWWNNLNVIPSIDTHRLSYFCLWNLRKIYIRKNKGRIRTGK
jgi:hypothetical protein